MGRALVKQKNNRSNEGWRERTVGIDDTVSARLFAIAFDLFSPTLIAGATDSSALLQGQRLRFEFGMIGKNLVGRRKS